MAYNNVLEAGFSPFFSFNRHNGPYTSVIWEREYQIKITFTMKLKAD